VPGALLKTLREDVRTVEALPVEAVPVEAVPVEAVPVEARPVEPVRRRRAASPAESDDRTSGVRGASGNLGGGVGAGGD